MVIEVKYRKNRDCGNPIEAVDRRKQIRICRVADYYRISKRIPDSSSFRFDVIAILDRELEWYKNAFNYIV